MAESPKRAGQNADRIEHRTLIDTTASSSPGSSRHAQGTILIAFMEKRRRSRREEPLFLDRGYRERHRRSVPRPRRG